MAAINPLSAMNTDIQWMVTESGALRWWTKAGGEFYKKGTISFVALSTEEPSFKITFQDAAECFSLALPNCEWELMEQKFKSTNTKVRAMLLCFQDGSDTSNLLDRIQITVPIAVTSDDSSSSGKVFPMAICRAQEEKKSWKVSRKS